MGEHVHINTEMKVIYYPDSKAQLTRDDIIMIFGEPEAVDRCIEFAASLQRLKLTYEEVAVLKAIIITFRGKGLQHEVLCTGGFFLPWVTDIFHTVMVVEDFVLFWIALSQ